MTIKWNRYPAEEIERFVTRPIFIIGSPRTGTTVMRNILDSHPNLFSPNMETFFFDAFARILKGPVWDNNYAGTHFSRKEYINWARDCFLQLVANFAKLSGKNRLVEKTPRHSQHINLIREVFPEAQFIHMIRNGYDVCRSLNEVTIGPKIIEEQATLWKQRVNMARKVSVEIGTSNYKEIRLEDLKRNFVETMKDLCAYLGEDYFENMEEYYLPSNNSFRQKLRKFNSNSESSRGQLA